MTRIEFRAEIKSENEELIQKRAYMDYLTDNNLMVILDGVEEQQIELNKIDFEKFEARKIKTSHESVENLIFSSETSRNIFFDFLRDSKFSNAEELIDILKQGPSPLTRNLIVHKITNDDSFLELNLVNSDEILNYVLDLQDFGIIAKFFVQKYFQKIEEFMENARIPLNEDICVFTSKYNSFGNKKKVFVISEQEDFVRTIKDSIFHNFEQFQKVVYKPETLQFIERNLHEIEEIAVIFYLAETNFEKCSTIISEFLPSFKGQSNLIFKLLQQHPFLLSDILRQDEKAIFDIFCDLKNMKILKSACHQIIKFGTQNKSILLFDFLQKLFLNKNEHFHEELLSDRYDLFLLNEIFYENLIKLTDEHLTFFLSISELKSQPIFTFFSANDFLTNLLLNISHFNEVNRTKILRIAIKISTNFKIFNKENTSKLSGPLKRLFLDVEKTDNMLSPLFSLLISQAEPYFDNFLEL